MPRRGGYSARTAWGRVGDWIGVVGAGHEAELNDDLRHLPVPAFNAKYGTNFGARAKPASAAATATFNRRNHTSLSPLEVAQEQSFRGQLRKIYAPLERSRGARASRGYNSWGAWLRDAHDHRQLVKTIRHRNAWRRLVLQHHPACKQRQHEYLWGPNRQRVLTSNRGKMRVHATNHAWVGSYILVSAPGSNRAGVPLEDFQSMVFGPTPDPRYKFSAWAKRIQQYFRVARMYRDDFSHIESFYIAFDIYLRADTPGARTSMYRVPWAPNLDALDRAIDHMLKTERDRERYRKRKRGNTPTEKTLVRCIKPKIALIARHKFVYRRREVGKRKGVFIAWY